MSIITSIIQFFSRRTAVIYMTKFSGEKSINNKKKKKKKKKVLGFVNAN